MVGHASPLPSADPSFPACAQSEITKEGWGARPPVILRSSSLDGKEPANYRLSPDDVQRYLACLAKPDLIRLESTDFEHAAQAVYERRAQPLYGEELRNAILESLEGFQVLPGIEESCRPGVGNTRLLAQLAFASKRDNMLVCSAGFAKFVRYCVALYIYAYFETPVVDSRPPTAQGLYTPYELSPTCATPLEEHVEKTQSRFHSNKSNKSRFLSNTCDCDVFVVPRQPGGLFYVGDNPVYFLDVGTAEVGFFAYSLSAKTDDVMSRLNALRCLVSKKIVSPFQEPSFFEDIAAEHEIQPLGFVHEGVDSFAKEVISQYCLDEVSEGGQALKDLFVVVGLTGLHSDIMHDVTKRLAVLDFFASVQTCVSSKLHRRFVMQVFVPCGELQAQFEVRATEWLVQQAFVDTTGGGIGQLFSEFRKRCAFDQLSGESQVTLQQFVQAMAEQGVSEEALAQHFHKLDRNKLGNIGYSDFAAGLDSDDRILSAYIRRNLFMGTISAGGGSAQLTMVVGASHVQLFSIPMGNKVPLQDGTLSLPLTWGQIDAWRKRVNKSLANVEYPQGLKGLYVGISAAYFAASLCGVADRVVTKPRVTVALQSGLHRCMGAEVADLRAVANLTLVLEIISYAFDDDAVFLFKRTWKVGQDDSQKYIANWNLGLFIEQVSRVEDPACVDLALTRKNKASAHRSARTWLKKALAERQQFLKTKLIPKQSLLDQHHEDLLDFIAHKVKEKFGYDLGISADTGYLASNAPLRELEEPLKASRHAYHEATERLRHNERDDFHLICNLDNERLYYGRLLKDSVVLRFNELRTAKGPFTFWESEEVDFFKEEFGNSFAELIHMERIEADEELIQPPEEVGDEYMPGPLALQACEAQETLKELVAPGTMWDKAGKYGRHTTHEGRYCDFAYDSGPKTLKRILHKAEYKYLHYGENKYRRVRDMARLSFQFNTCKAMEAGLKFLKEDFRAVFVENRFKTPTAVGWMDITVLIELPLPFGVKHICEIQLSHKLLNDARNTVHHHYVALREKLPTACNVRSQDLDKVQGVILEELERWVGNISTLGLLDIPFVDSPLEPALILDLGSGEMGFYRYSIDIDSRKVSVKLGEKHPRSFMSYFVQGGFVEEFLEALIQGFGESVFREATGQHISLFAGMTGLNREAMLDMQNRGELWRFVNNVEVFFKKKYNQTLQIHMFLPSGQLEAQFELHATHWLVRQATVDITPSAGWSSMPLCQAAIRRLCSGDTVTRRWFHKPLAFLGLSTETIDNYFNLLDRSGSDELHIDDLTQSVESGHPVICAYTRHATFMGVLAAGGGSAQVAHHGSMEQNSGKDFTLVFFSAPIGNGVPIKEKILTSPVSKEQLDMWLKRIREELVACKFPQGLTGLYVGISATYYAAKVCGITDRIMPKPEAVQSLSKKLETLSPEDVRTNANLTLVRELLDYCLSDEAVIIFKRNWTSLPSDGGDSMSYVANWTLGWYVSQFEVHKPEALADLKRATTLHVIA